VSATSGPTPDIYEFFIDLSRWATPHLWRRTHDIAMADFLVVLFIIAFALAMLGLIWALDRV